MVGCPYATVTDFVVPLISKDLLRGASRSLFRQNLKPGSLLAHHHPWLNTCAGPVGHVVHRLVFSVLIRTPAQEWDSNLVSFVSHGVCMCVHISVLGSYLARE
jgi:hypothetical protein